MKRCMFGYCSNSDESGIPLLQFPSDQKFAIKWDRLIAKTRKDWYSGRHTKTSVVCACHFPAEHFLNLTQWRRGFSTRLRLRKDAVPKFIKVQKKHEEMFRKISTADPDQLINGGKYTHTFTGINHKLLK